MRTKYFIKPPNSYTKCVHTKFSMKKTLLLIQYCICRHTNYTLGDLMMTCKCMIIYRPGYSLCNIWWDMNILYSLVTAHTEYSWFLMLYEFEAPYSTCRILGFTVLFSTVLYMWYCTDILQWGTVLSTKKDLRCVFSIQHSKPVQRNKFIGLVINSDGLSIQSAWGDAVNLYKHVCVVQYCRVQYLQ